MLDLDSFSSVANVVDLRLHLVEVALEAFFRFLIGKFDFFQTSSQLFLLLLLGQVGLLKLV